MRLFVLGPKTCPASPEIISEISEIGHELAASTANIQGIIIDPLGFYEEENSIFRWEIDDYQRMFLKEMSWGVPIIVYDADNVSFLKVLDKPNFISSDYDMDDSHWIKTSDQEFHLDEIFPLKDDPWTEMKKSLDSSSASLSDFENKFIDTIMARDESRFIDKPVEQTHHITATLRTETSFLSEENEML